MKPGPSEYKAAVLATSYQHSECMSMVYNNSEFVLLNAFKI